MIIRKATGSDADDLKTLYFEFLTHYPDWLIEIDVEYRSKHCNRLNTIT